MKTERGARMLNAGRAGWLAALAITLVVVAASSGSAQTAMSIAQARKAAIDAWNSDAATPPYVSVTGIVTSQPTQAGTGIGSGNMTIQDGPGTGTVIDGKRYSNAIKVYFGTANVPTTIPMEGDAVTVVGAAKIYTAFGMEVEIDASMSSGPFARVINVTSAGNPLPEPVTLKITDLPALDGLAGAENRATRNTASGQEWYPLPSPNPASPYHFVDNPYQGALVTITNAVKWNTGSTFFLSDLTDPSKSIRVRVASSTGINTSAGGDLTDGNTDPVSGVFADRQMLVGLTQYTFAQLEPRKLEDVQQTTTPVAPYFKATSTNVTTANRSRLPGTIAQVRAKVDAAQQTVTADLSAFGLGSAVPLASGATANDWYAYDLVIPQGQAPGQYVVDISYGPRKANTLVTVGAQVALLGQALALPDDVYVTVTEPAVITAGAMNTVAAPNVDPNPTFKGFKSWLWVSDTSGVPGIQLFGFPGGAAANPTQYAPGELLRVMGQMTTFSGKREIQGAGGTTKAAGTAPVPKPKIMTIGRAYPGPGLSPGGVLATMVGQASNVVNDPIGKFYNFLLTDGTGKSASVEYRWRNVDGVLAPTVMPSEGQWVKVTGIVDPQGYTDPELGWDTTSVDLLPRSQDDVILNP